MPDRRPEDWTLPNSILALIWRLPHSTVVRMRREAGAPAPGWNLRHASIRRHPVYLAAVKGEEARAAKGGPADGR